MQVNVRLDEEIVAELDRVAATDGSSRAVVVRRAVLAWFESRRWGEADALYRRAYESAPETADELRRAESNAQRLATEEPWALIAMPAGWGGRPRW